MEFVDHHIFGVDIEVQAKDIMPVRSYLESQLEADSSKILS